MFSFQLFTNNNIIFFGSPVLYLTLRAIITAVQAIITTRTAAIVINVFFIFHSPVI